MKSLLEYLMLEGEEDKKQDPKPKKKDTPDGFVVIDTRGRLSKQAKIAIGGTFKEGMKSAEDSATVRKNIKEKLKAKSVDPKSVKSIINGIIVANNDLDELFKKKASSKSFGDDGIIISFKDESWRKLAGTESSSKRLVKFWLQSSLLAYGSKKWNTAEISVKDNFIAISGG